MGAVALLLLAVGLTGIRAAAGPSKPEELFQQNRIWNVHLSLTADAWKSMQPTGGPPSFFGGPPPGGGFGPPPGGPGPGGPPGPPPGGFGGPPPGGFGPGMFLAPVFMTEGDRNRDGKLTAAEFTAIGAKWFAEWDREKQGRVSADQVRDGLTTTMMRPFAGMGGPGMGGMSLQGPPGGPNGLAAMLGIKFPWAHATVDFEGTTLRDAGLRYKGNGTYVESQASLKRPLKLDINRFDKKQKLAGVTTINLHNCVADPSWINDVLSYRLFREAGVAAPRTAYARVHLTVPGQHNRAYLGLYELVEDVDDLFIERTFGTKEGAVLKPSTPRPFTYLGADWKAYEQPYEPKTKLTPAQQQRIMSFCKLVSSAPDAEFSTKLGSYVDLDDFARFMAVTVLLSDLDSILLTGQNYYVHLDPRTEKLRFIAWDKDHSFGYFPMGSQEEREQLSLWKPWQGENPFLERVFRTPAFRTLYQARLREFSKALFRPERLTQQVEEIAKVIRPAVKEESPEKLARFEKAVAGEAIPPQLPGGLGGPPGGPPAGGPPMPFFQPMKPLKPFVALRATSVQNQLAGKSQGRTIPSFGPGMFLGPAWMTALDTNKDSTLLRQEMATGFARWFKSWSPKGGSSLTSGQLAEGINRAFAPPGAAPRG